MADWIHWNFCTAFGKVNRPWPRWVPETWAVSMRVTAFMGGHSLKAREGVQTTKTLVVKGVAIMGGIEVRN